MSRIVAFVAGLMIGTLLGRQRSASPQVEYSGPAASVPRPAPPAASATVSHTAADSLTEIDGIGPAFEQALNKLGIVTFADLARQTPEDLAAQLAARVTAERIRRDRWIEQAQEKAKSTS